MALLDRKTDKPAAPAGDKDKPAAVAGGGMDPAAQAAAKAKAAVDKRRPGRPTNAERGVGGAGEASEQLAAELDRLFAPDNLKPLMRAFADYKLATTGREFWNVPDGEVTSLAVTGGTALKYTLTVSPKWIALTLFLANLTFTYGTRILKDLALNRQERAEKAKREAAKAGSGGA